MNTRPSANLNTHPSADSDLIIQVFSRMRHVSKLKLDGDSKKKIVIDYIDSQFDITDSTRVFIGELINFIVFLAKHRKLLKIINSKVKRCSSNCLTI